jgi:hypothetical protein
MRLNLVHKEKRYVI